MENRKVIEVKDRLGNLVEIDISDEVCGKFDVQAKEGGLVKAKHGDRVVWPWLSQSLNGESFTVMGVLAGMSGFKKGLWILYDNEGTVSPFVKTTKFIKE